MSALYIKYFYIMYTIIFLQYVIMGYLLFCISASTIINTIFNVLYCLPPQARKINKDCKGLQKIAN